MAPALVVGMGAGADIGGSGVGIGARILRTGGDSALGAAMLVGALAADAAGRGEAKGEPDMRGTTSEVVGGRLLAAGA